MTSFYKRFAEQTGGNLDLYLKEYFVSKKIAWQAIGYFLKSGERDPQLIWEIAEIPAQRFQTAPPDNRFRFRK